MDTTLGAESDTVAAPDVAYLLTLPRRRYSFQAKGKILELPRTGMVVVPFEQTRHGWHVVVVTPDRAGVYQPDGYNLLISELEIETATERQVGDQLLQPPRD